MRAAGALLAVLSAGAAADDDVVAELAWRSGGRLDYHVADLHLSPVPPPALASPVGAKEPHFARPVLARRPLPLAVDAAPALWIDLDGDGELADERPVAFQALGERIEATVELVLDGARLRVLFFRRAGEPVSTLHVVPLAHREGTVVLAGRLRRVAVYDGTGRLAFDDPVRDAWFLDRDGDGRLDRSATSAERVRPGRPFRLAGAGYAVRALDPAAGRVAFRPVAEAPAPPPPRWEAEAPDPPGRRAPGGDLRLQDLRRQFERPRSSSGGAAPSSR